jgi:hypothetical protein
LPEQSEVQFFLHPELQRKDFVNFRSKTS